MIKIDLNKYDTGHLVDHFGVCRQTIYRWKLSKTVPKKYLQKVLELYQFA